MEELREAIRKDSSRLQVDQSRKTESIVIPVTPVDAKTGQLLTTGEAYEVLKSKGFDKSVGTFRRILSESLKSGVLPESLSQYGLLANSGIRLNANPKDNSVRWLFFN